MTVPSDGGRRRKRMLSAQEKYQIWQQLLSKELSQREAAERWGVDPTTIMRIESLPPSATITSRRRVPLSLSPAGVPMIVAGRPAQVGGPAEPPGRRPGPRRGRPAAARPRSC